MAELKRLDPKPHRKMGKTQILEILEQNAKLYKDEDAFIHHIVNLTLYLLEYEYDWSESDIDPPHAEAPSGESITEEIEIGDEVKSKTKPKAKAHPSMTTTHSGKSKQKTCPYCGLLIEDLLICPSCRNMVR